MNDGDVAGRAEEAMDFYISVFENAHRGETARYPAGVEPDQEGTLMYADFALNDQWFACMDSAQAHDFNFDEGISLQILCEDQDEVDYYWDALPADGGEESQCGWLTDRYGVSWQVVPTRFVEMTKEGVGEQTGYERALEAMLDMQKLDIGVLETAFRSGSDCKAPKD